jgi:hypothetical protein
MPFATTSDHLAIDQSELGAIFISLELSLSVSDVRPPPCLAA